MVSPFVTCGDIVVMDNLSSHKGPAVREQSFGHEVRNAWFFDADATFLTIGAQASLLNATRLFENPVDALCYFADSQIAQGLTYLFNTMAGNDPGWFSPAIPVELRLRVIRGTVLLFEMAIYRDALRS
jgi:hypothetical protein